MKHKKIFSLFVVFMMVLSTFVLTSNISLAATMDGLGTEESPYLIRTVEDLYRIPANPTAHYKLMNDLDLENVERTPMAVFKGVLDGGGHSIKNLNIVSYDDVVGLFLKVIDALIVNLKITNSHVGVLVVNVGTIAGISENTKFLDIEINNCYVSGRGIIGGICGQSLKGSSYVNCLVSNTKLITLGGGGGLTGNGNNCYYQNCYSTDNIIKGDTAGGITGGSVASEFVQCFSTSDLEGRFTIGGLTGGSTQGLIITECFTSGKIKATYQGLSSAIGIGGFIGDINNSSVLIENSYSLCKFDKGYSSILGLIGQSRGQTVIKESYFAGEATLGKGLNIELIGSLKNCYFDKGKNAIPTSAEQARTAEQMFHKSNYEEWDFENVWSIDEGKNYPRLKFELEIDIPEKSTNKLDLILEPDERLLLSIDTHLSENKNVNWISSDEAVATVDNEGFVMAIASGETVITATSKSGATQKINILVVDSANDYRLAADLKVGESCRATVDKNQLKTGITWSVMDESVATVSSKGKITAQGVGLTLVTATNDEDKVVGQVYIRVR